MAVVVSRFAVDFSIVRGNVIGNVVEKPRLQSLTGTQNGPGSAVFENAVSIPDVPYGCKSNADVAVSKAVSIIDFRSVRLLMPGTLSLLHQVFGVCNPFGRQPE